LNKNIQVFQFSYRSFFLKSTAFAAFTQIILAGFPTKRSLQIFTFPDYPVVGIALKIAHSLRQQDCLGF